LRGALLVARYRIKAMIVNPLLKRRSGLVVLALMVGLAAMMVLALLHSAAPSEGVREGESTLVRAVRSFLRSRGIAKDLLVDAAAALTTAAVLLTMLGRPVMVVEDADYELLLAQPLKVREYLTGLFLANLVHTAVFSVYLLGAAPMAAQFSGNLAKSVLILPAFMVVCVQAMVITHVLSALRVALNRGGLGWVPRVAVPAYLAAAAAHSAWLGRPSPLLSLPLRPAMAALVYCFTRAEEVGDVLLNLGYQLPVLLVTVALQQWCFGLVTPEDVASTASPASGGAQRVRVGYGGAVVYQYIVLGGVLNPRHMAALGLAVALCYAAGRGLAALGLVPGDLLASPFLWTFLLPFIVAEAMGIYITAMLAADLPPLWIYRVYSAGPARVAGALVLKYSLCITECVLVLAVLEHSLGGDPTCLWMPVALAPVSVLASSLLVLLACLMASRRLVVKRLPSGPSVVEEVTSLVIIAFLIPLFMGSVLAYRYLVRAAPHLLPHLLLGSLAAAGILFAVLVPLVGRVVWSMDLRT